MKKKNKNKEKGFVEYWKKKKSVRNLILFSRLKIIATGISIINKYNA